MSISSSSRQTRIQELSLFDGATDVGGAGVDLGNRLDYYFVGNQPGVRVTYGAKAISGNTLTSFAPIVLRWAHSPLTPDTNEADVVETYTPEAVVGTTPAGGASSNVHVTVDVPCKLPYLSIEILSAPLFTTAAGNDTIEIVVDSFFFFGSKSGVDAGGGGGGAGIYSAFYAGTYTTAVATITLINGINPGTGVTTGHFTYSNGIITYTGADTKDFIFTYTSGIRTQFGSGNPANLEIRKNDVALGTEEGQMDYGLGNTYDAVSMSVLVTLATNDNLRVMITPVYAVTTIVNHNNYIIRSL